jgi:hypothetical protein
MPRASTVHAVIAIGIDLGKSTLHMIGLDSCGAIVLERRSRADASHRGSRTCHPASLASKQEWRHTMLLVSLSRLVTM